MDIQLSDFADESQKDCCHCTIRKETKAKLLKILSIIYDIFAIVVGTLDLITDILVVISYYNEGYTTLFIISVIILVIAQLSYCVGFALKNANGWDITELIKAFFCCLPFAPFMTFIFFLTDHDENILAKYLENSFSFLTFGDNSKVLSHSEFRNIMQQKISKHLGFILEAGLEALPQSMLQMFAIVYYGESNLLTIGSIFLSLISVSSKSLIFCVYIANDFISILFYWICMIIDFFGIFFVVCWVFYDYSNNDNDDVFTNEQQNAFDIVSSLWMYKVFYFVTPFVATFAVMVIYKNTEVLRLDSGFCSHPCIPIMLIIIYPIMVCMGVVIFEITNFMFVVFIICRMYTLRYPATEKGLNNWYSLLDWVDTGANGYNLSNFVSSEDEDEDVNAGKYMLKAGSVKFKLHRDQTVPFVCSVKQDRIIRICCINYVLNENRRPARRDSHLYRFLEEEMDTSFVNVTFAHLRSNTNLKQQAEFIAFIQYCINFLSGFSDSDSSTINQLLGGKDGDYCSDCHVCLIEFCLFASCKFYIVHVVFCYIFSLL